MVMRPIAYQFAKQSIDAYRFVGEGSLLALEWLKSQPKYQDARSLIPFSGKVYSQNDEDGIIAEIFRRIGVSDRRCFIELGVGDGLENNTLALLFRIGMVSGLRAVPSPVRKSVAGLSRHWLRVSCD